MERDSVRASFVLSDGDDIHGWDSDEHDVPNAPRRGGRVQLSYPTAHNLPDDADHVGPNPPIIAGGETTRPTSAKSPTNPILEKKMENERRIALKKEYSESVRRRNTPEHVRSSPRNGRQAAGGGRLDSAVGPRSMHVSVPGTSPSDGMKDDLNSTELEYSATDDDGDDNDNDNDNTVHSHDNSAAAGTAATHSRRRSNLGDNSFPKPSPLFDNFSDPVMMKSSSYPNDIHASSSSIHSGSPSSIGRVSKMRSPPLRVPISQHYDESDEEDNGRIEDIEPIRSTSSRNAQIQSSTKPSPYSRPSSNFGTRPSNVQRSSSAQSSLGHRGNRPSSAAGPQRSNGDRQISIDDSFSDMRDLHRELEQYEFTDRRSAATGSTGSAAGTRRPSSARSSSRHERENFEGHDGDFEFQSTAPSRRMPRPQSANSLRPNSTRSVSARGGSEYTLGSARSVYSGSPFGVEPSQKRVRNDPVSRFHEMKKCWSQDQFLKNEKRRTNLSDIPSLKSSGTGSKSWIDPMVAPRRTKSVQQMINTYVPPTERRRDDIRWMLKQKLMIH